MADASSAGYAETELVEAKDLMPPDIQSAMPQVNAAAIAADSSGKTATVDIAAAPTLPAAPAAASAAALPPAAAVKPAAGSAAAATCAEGMTFDPVYHECTLRGKPVHGLAGLSAADLAALVPTLRTDGKTLKRRRTPLADIQTQSVAADPASLDAPPPAAAAAPVQPAPAQVPAVVSMPTDVEVKACAATVAGLQLMIMRTALGDKIGEDEEQCDALVGAWEATVRHYGWGAFHPLLAVAVVTGGMIVTAASKHEDTRTRIGQMKDWCVAKWTAALYWWRHKRGQRPVEA